MSATTTSTIAGDELTELRDPREAARWLASRCSGDLRSDSRRVRPGDALLAWPGGRHDARGFVAEALAAGAAAALVEAEGCEAWSFDPKRVAVVRGLKAEAGRIASAWFQEPSERLSVLAVTGTNGKTSISWWLAQSMSYLGRPCGVVGTLGVGVPPEVRSTGLTTPDALALQAAFHGFAAQGFMGCAIEASSIGLVEHRLAGTRVAVALLSNLTQDHLDYHGTMDRYWAAKRMLFDWPGLGAAVVNVDDARGRGLADELRDDATRALWTVSVAGPARLAAQGVHYAEGGLAFDLVESAGDGGDVLDRRAVRTTLIGDYNVHNVLLVVGGLRALGVSLAEATEAMRVLRPVPGRMQRLPSDPREPLVVIDYAHTPDALDKALASMRALVQARGGALWCVFGCGGDRDPVKRPMMGGVAARLADRVVLTNDNPRTESPEVIAAAVLSGVTEERRDAVQVVLDRAQAIELAVRTAGPDDVVLVAGKGHEDYQEIGRCRVPFSDEQVALAALTLRRGVIA